MNMMTNTTTLKHAARQWASRPDDQKFTSLPEMLDFSANQRANSRSLSLSSKHIEARPVEDENGRMTGLSIVGPNEAPTLPTHFSFGQVAARANAPAGYLRKLPSDIAADCINHGLRGRGYEDVGALLRMNEGQMPELGAMTGPNYGRVWNADIIAALIERFGDGVTGDFTVPSIGGRSNEVITKDNTMLFASDRDMFVFLADETNKLTVPNRRNGLSGSLSRGFFVWNSEVGSTSLGICTFLYDHVCNNRWVMGAQGIQQIRIRHTASAPDKFVDEVAPALLAYRDSSAEGIENSLRMAQAKRIGDEQEVENFLTKRHRFTVAQAKAINLAHIAEEGRPIESLWDAGTGITAYAKGIKHQDERVAVERAAGRVLELV
jgi:hypothetical protein